MTMLEEIQGLYESRRDRLTHPEGKFDHAGRWYPSADEQCECCQSIRYPSRSYPYSLMNHCRSWKHVQNLIHKRHDQKSTAA